MAAHPVSRSSSKSKKYVPSERRLARSDDPEIALGMQMSAVVERLEIDVLLVCDLDGAAIASAGDEAEVIDLAQFAAAAVKDSDVSGPRTIVTTRGFVHVDLVDARGRTFVLAAFARHGVPAPIGVARAVAGAARILRQGLTVGSEAALPLIERGWGDWEGIG
jgi:hypothetical protein